MRINPSIFKGYDIRGVYPAELTPNAACRIGGAFVEFLKKKRKASRPTVVLGRDARASSDTLRQNLVDGILTAGGDCFDLSITTSPHLAFATVTMPRVDGGVMITASHSPAEYNGFKFALPKLGWIGKPEGLDAIQAYASKKLTTSKRVGSLHDAEKNSQLYIKEIHKRVPSLPEVRAVIDAAGGSTTFLLPKLLVNYSLFYKPLFFTPDPTFAEHTPNPLMPEVDALMKIEVTKGKFHIGVAFDGDGDRISFFDERGKRIRTDVILALLAREELKQKKHCAFVYEITHSRSLRPFIEAHGGSLSVTKVGRTNIPREMERTGAILAGETSAHLFHGDFYNIDSGLLSMMKVFQMVGSLHQPLSEAVKTVSTSTFHQIPLPIQNPKRALRIIEKQYQKHIISRLDGVSVQFPSYWFNMRMSNTEPLVRLTIDADSSSEFETRVKEIKGLIGAK